MVLRTAVFRDDVERRAEKFSNLAVFLFASKSQVQELAKGASESGAAAWPSRQNVGRTSHAIVAGTWWSPPRRFGMVLRDEQVTVTRSVGLCREHMAGR